MYRENFLLVIKQFLGNTVFLVSGAVTDPIFLKPNTSLGFSEAVLREWEPISPVSLVNSSTSGSPYLGPYPYDSILEAFSSSGWLLRRIEICLHSSHLQADNSPNVIFFYSLDLFHIYLTTCWSLVFGCPNITLNSR